MLSIGGDDSRKTYSLSSADDARKVADYIWDNFLGGHSNSRPFGDAILDGVDFDIEGGESHYAALARRLHDLAAGSGRKYYLTAAPQCPFQNNILNGALSTGLFDYVWVQFYNNPVCEFKSNNPGSFRNSWNQWARSIHIAGKFFVGLPAAPAAAGSGYVPSEALKNQLLPIVRSPKYGGVMLWNRYFDIQNGYSLKIKSSV